MSQNILVISYYFPPYKRVGGRRWAKHSKYLNRLGENAYVLTGEFPNSSSPWDDDILEYKDKITRLALEPVYRPYFETTLPKGLLDKLRWKFSFYSWQFRKKRLSGNYMDASRPNKSRFLAKAKELITKRHINTVILSVGPFDFSEMLIDLKREFPKIKYILDYRDPWEESLEGLSQKQKDEELAKQLRVLKTADLVMSVNEDISQKLRGIYPGAKVITLPHGVDEDFLKLSQEQNTPKQKMDIKIVYGGELYGGLEKEMETYVAFADLLAKKSGKACKSDFYSPYPSYETILKGTVDLHPMLLKDAYKETLLQSDLILLFKSPLSSEAFFSSKFYEILCLRKPILFFGNKGMVPDFIEEHQLGFHVRKDNLESVTEKILGNMTTGSIPGKSYDLSQHSFETHTRSLIKELRTLKDAV